MNYNGINISFTPLKTPAKWTDDCQGKKDYDGSLIRVSTRYWPGNRQQNGMCSANSSIVINHGEVDEYEYGDYFELTSKAFEAPTEEEVKKMVEEWVQGEFGAIQMMLIGLYKLGSKKK